MNLQLKLSSVILGLLLFIYNEGNAQFELNMFNDSISIADKSTLFPSIGISGNGIFTGSGLHESQLRAHELTINQTSLLPFHYSSKLNENSLTFEYADSGIWDYEWAINQSPDPRRFELNYAFEKKSGISLLIFGSPFKAEVDTSINLTNVFLQDYVGINVDSAKESRLTVFSHNDIYTGDHIGAIQAYKNTGEVGAAVSGIGNTTGDDKSTPQVAGMLGTFGANTSRIGVYGYAFDSLQIAVMGGNGGGFYDPTRWGALGTKDFAVYSNGPQFSTSSASWSTSDARLKMEIKKQNSMLDQVMRLAPKSYKYSNNEEFKAFSFPQEVQHGFIAQEVEKIFPELVKEVALISEQKSGNNNIYKAINYNGFTSILTAALQESQTQNIEQEKEIRMLKNKQADLESKFQEQSQLLNSIISKIENLASHNPK